MMRKTLGRVLVSLISLSCATAVQAGVSISTTCEDGVVQVFGDYYIDDSTWQAIVTQWRFGNLCDQAYQPVDADPVPIALGYHEYTTSFPAPDPDEWIEYRAFILTEDGDLFPAPPGGDVLAYDWTACANPVLSRGYITGSPGDVTLHLDVCSETCWFLYLEPDAFFFVSGIDPATYEEYLNSDTPVNIWGQPYIDWGARFIWASAIGPVPPDEPPCGPAIATAPVGWGTVKSWYR